MICEACVGVMKARFAPLHAAVTAQRTVPTVAVFLPLWPDGRRV